MKFKKNISTLLLSSLLFSSTLFAQNSDGEKFEVEPSLIQQISDGIKNAISSSGSTLDEVKLKLNSIQASLDSGALKGAKGDQGLVGPQGLTGATGAKGDQGDVGPIGLQGVKGDTGLQGIQGIKGDIGLTGSNGTNGINGLDGKSVVVNKTTIAAGGASICITGGTLFDFYKDVDANGSYTVGVDTLLSSDKVCNGDIGATGSTGATGSAGGIGPQGNPGVQGLTGYAVGVQTSVLSADATCLNGGSLLSFFIDQNADGIKNGADSFISGATSKICKGDTGAVGATGPGGSTGATGAGCTSVAGPSLNTLTITCGTNSTTITGAITDSVGTVTSNIRAGMVVPYAGATLPSGWLWCDGTEYTPAAYPQLYTAIGTTYNTQANQTVNTAPAYTTTSGNFRVPDYRGMFLRGSGSVIGIDGSTAIATTLGQYQADANQSHTHSNSNRVGTTLFSGNRGDIIANSWVTDGSINYSFNNSSGGQESRPRNKGVNYIIKANDDAYSLTGLSLATASQAGLIKSYEEYSHTSTFSGPFLTVSKTLNIVKIGKVVTISIPDMYFVGNNTAASVTMTTLLPAAYRPSGVRRFPAAAVANGVDQASPGIVYINSAGLMYFFYTSAVGNFPATTSSVGITGIDVSYIVP